MRIRTLWRKSLKHSHEYAKTYRRCPSFLADEACVFEVGAGDSVHPARHLTKSLLMQLELLHQLAHHHPLLVLEVRLIVEEVHDDLHGALRLL